MPSKLKVVERIEETKDSVSLYFKPPFFGGYSYKSGQFLTLKVNISGEDHLRAYSLNSSPGIDKLLSVTIKKVDGGLVSNYIFDQIKIGDRLEVLKPKGTFILSPNRNSSNHIVLFGAGSGITPLFSMAKYILHNQTNTRVSLVYANQNEKSIIFKSKLEDLTQKFDKRFSVHHYIATPLNGWAGHTGLITSDRLDDIIAELKIDSLNNAEFYMCGPTGFMTTIEEGLLIKGIPSEKIFKESFVPNAPINLDETDLNFVASTVKIKLNRTEYGVHVPANKTILDAALDNKVKIPFSCGSGICATCLCKVENGEVKMVGKHSLSEKDMKRGYILACISYAASPEIVIKVE